MVAQKTLDAVLTLLHEHPGLSVADVAMQAKLGRSTAGKALAELDRQERAHRVLPAQGTKNSALQPARWFLFVDTPESLAIADTVLEQPAQDAEAPGAGAADPAQHLDHALSATPGTEPDGDHDRTTPAGSGNAVDARPRLRKGELRTLVLDQLNANPDAEHTASALSKTLGRSSGAISNALVRLCLDGQAIETCSRPRRYGAAPRKAA